MVKALSSGKLTAGDAWKAPRTFPWRLAVLALVVVVAVGAAVWYFALKPTPSPPPPVDNTPKPAALSAVNLAGVGTLLNQFGASSHEVKGKVSDGSLSADIHSSTTLDGQFGYGTVSVAGVDGTTLLAEGITYIKGAPRFWSALGVNANFPGWVQIEPGFLGDRIFYPTGVVTAALAPVESSTILGDNYTARDGAKAVFGPNGLEEISIAGYDVKVLPANNDGVFGTAKPQFDSRGEVARMERQGAVWVVNPPAP